MKRAVIDHYGPAGLIRVEEVDSFPHKGDNIVIENYASSVNPVDYKVRNGSIRLLSGLRFPKQLGGDFSGVIIHSKDESFPVGTEVFGFLSPLQGGAYAEEIATDKKIIARKPGNLSLYEAGVLSIAAMTAFEGLMTKGRVEKGYKVLINGCTGGVGAFATQLASGLGANVTGTCSAKNMDIAREIGAERVFDYHTLKPEEVGNDFDIVYDTSGKIKWRELKKFGHKGTKFMTCAINGDILVNAILSGKLKIIVARPDSKKLSYLGELIEKLDIHPVISESYALDELNEAHAMLESGGVAGKISIRIR